MGFQDIGCDTVVIESQTFIILESIFRVGKVHVPDRYGAFIEVAERGVTSSEVDWSGGWGCQVEGHERRWCWEQSWEEVQLHIYPTCEIYYMQLRHLTNLH